MSIYFTKEKIELSNWDFSIDSNNPIDCESCQDLENFMCEWCVEVEWEDRLYTLELIAADLQELGWTKMYVPAWLGGWSNDVRGLKDPLLEVTRDILNRSFFHMIPILQVQLIYLLYLYLLVLKLATMIDQWEKSLL